MSGYYGWWLRRYFPGSWKEGWGKLRTEVVAKGLRWLLKKVEGTEVKAGVVATVMAMAAILMPGRGWAQDGNAGISEANTLIRSYFDTGVTLMYGIGALLGLIGAVRVYQKWSHGDHDTGKVAAAWFGACVFLVVVATVIRQFFGL